MGEKGVAPHLAHLVGDREEARYEPLIQSNCRTGVELAEAWARLQGEGRAACELLGREFEGPLSVPVAGIGEGSTTGATRKLLSRAREELRLALFERSLTLQRDKTLRGLKSWKERV